MAQVPSQRQKSHSFAYWLMTAKGAGLQAPPRSFQPASERARHTGRPLFFGTRGGTSGCVGHPKEKRAGPWTATAKAERKFCLLTRRIKEHQNKV
ncbi:hypothetical protein OUZ56_010804 [Daphnia magna]|uniref:Uncharacterized protein n=1 Tax=Daphnia magna TaxID=35525 RepID=A0ABQ9YYJ8_9CRUS|nr:hypothetical protein OUZ56_010804 [Daphnia magna]